MTDTTTVAANTTTANILAGKQAEFLGRPTAVTIASVAAAAGIFVSVVLGDRILIDDQEISNANVWPIFPDHTLADGVGLGRLIIRYRNSTGAGIVVRTKINLTPVA